MIKLRTQIVLLITAFASVAQAGAMSREFERFHLASYAEENLVKAMQKGFRPSENLADLSHWFADEDSIRYLERYPMNINLIDLNLLGSIIYEDRIVMPRIRGAQVGERRFNNRTIQTEFHSASGEDKSQNVLIDSADFRGTRVRAQLPKDFNLSGAEITITTAEPLYMHEHWTKVIFVDHHLKIEKRDGVYQFAKKNDSPMILTGEASAENLVQRSKFSSVETKVISDEDADRFTTPIFDEPPGDSAAAIVD